MSSRTLAVCACLVSLAQGLCGQSPAAPRPREQWLEADDFYQSRGDLGRARQILENVRAHLRAEGKADAVEFINPTARLAKLLSRLGDFDRSAALYDEAGTLVGRRFGPESIEAARIGIAKATMFFWAQRYAEAEAAARDALARAERAQGPEQIGAATAAAILGAALQKERRFDEAAALLERSTAIHRKLLGAADERTRAQLFNLAQVYLAQERLDEARAALREARPAALAGDNDRASANDVEIHRGLLVLALTEKDADAARKEADWLFAAQVNLLKDVFPSMNEEERLNAKGQLELVDWYATLGEAERIARAVLQTKAITLDLLLAARTGAGDPDDPFGRLLDPAAGAEALQPANAEVQARLQRLRAGAAAPTRAPPGPAALYALTPAQMTAALPPDTAVIEFVRYRHELGGYRHEERYGALIFQSARAAGAALRWVPLKTAAAAIDGEIGRLLRDVHDPLAAGGAAAGLRTLYQQTWHAVAAELRAEVRNVLVCPDGMLCFLPFAALLGPDDRFLGEERLVSYLSAARDLFRAAPERPAAGGELVIFAAPDFGGPPSPADPAAASFRAVDARALGGLALPALPGAQREAEALSAVARSHRMASAVFVGREANEAAVRHLRQPRIVHFATHGFVLEPAASVVPSHPMDRSGLALAGARQTIAALARGGLPPRRESDGLLTAREVMDLPLRDTWLVTLAACDTGRGELRDGESVLGLRRGFLAAGVQNLLISLWALSDQNTAGFMRDFYEETLATSDPARALAVTQRAWLTRLRKEKGLAAALATAGPFVLNGSGRFMLPPEAR